MNKVFWKNNFCKNSFCKNNILKIVLYFFEIVCIPVFLLTSFWIIGVLLHLYVVFMLIRFIKHADFLFINIKNDIYRFYIMLLVCFFPVLGIIIALLLNKFRKVIYAPVSEYIEEDPEINVDDILENYKDKDVYNEEEKIVQEEIDFEPFVDIISGNDNYKKLRVISKLIKIPDIKNITLIKQALLDNDREVKLYAAAAMMKMDDILHDNIKRAKKNLENDCNVEYLNALAKEYIKYIKSGILDESLLKYYKDLVCELSNQIYNFSPDNKDNILMHIQNLIDVEAYKDVILIFKHAERLGIKNDEIIFLKAHVYFKLKKYNEVKNILKEYKKLDSNDKDIQEVLNIWQIQQLD